MPEIVIKVLDLVLIGIMGWGYHCAYMDMRPRLEDRPDVLKPKLGHIPEL